jgi:ABC-type spermidine/putrescine transport system permease subunit II
VKPEINAICTLMIASVAVLVVVASLLSKRYAMSQERNGAPV